MSDIRVVVDEELKTNAENVLSKLDLTMSQAVRMFLKQLVKNKALPFNPYNKETKAAMDRVKDNKNLITHKSLKSAFKEWDKD